MNRTSEFTDMSKYGYEVRIYSLDGKIDKTFTDEEFLEKICQCEHPTTLYHKSKNIILEVERILLPLKPQASSLIIETKGGSVVSKMTLEDFFGLLDIGKRIEIFDRFVYAKPLPKETSQSLVTEIQDLLRKSENK